MERRQIDVLYVMNPANMYYLTGFESVWYTADGPYGVIVQREEPGIVIIDYDWHENHIRQAAHWDDALFFDGAVALQTIIRAFRDRGWVKGKVGIEWHAAARAAPVVRAVADGLAEQGAAIVAGDWLVDHVRLIKSAAELDCVQRAASIADAALGQVPKFVRPGMTEIEIEA